MPKKASSSKKPAKKQTKKQTKPQKRKQPWQAVKATKAKKKICGHCGHEKNTTSCPHCGEPISKSCLRTTKIDRNLNQIVRYRDCKNCDKRYAVITPLHIRQGEPLQRIETST